VFALDEDAGGPTTDWWFGLRQNDKFIITKKGTIASPAFEMDPAGNLSLTGTLTDGSSRSIKHDISAVDTRKVLDKVMELEIANWRYNSTPGALHLGPMAEDFAAAFNLGETDQGIATVDADGVALAAIQGLNQKLEQRDRELETRDQRITALERELAELKQAVARMAGSGPEN
jgi:hypothetical protein